MTRTDKEWRGIASSLALVHRRAIGGKEEMPARVDPTFASDPTGRGFLNRGVPLFPRQTIEFLLNHRALKGHQKPTRGLSRFRCTSSALGGLPSGRPAGARDLAPSLVLSLVFGIGTYLEIGSWKFPSLGARVASQGLSRPGGQPRTIAPVFGLRATPGPGRGRKITGGGRAGDFTTEDTGRGKKS